MITKAIEMILFDEGCSEEEIAFIDETSEKDFNERYRPDQTILNSPLLKGEYERKD
tara:strand:- start:29 stop:196 length:168 start_codon:yes stop_codon:yes gene_type:complete